MQKKNLITQSLKLMMNCLTIYGVSLSFIFTPVAFAAKKASGSGIADDSNTWVTGINSFIGETAQMVQQYQQQNQMIQAQANLASQLQIKPLNAMYFPQCVISQAQTNIPENVCENIAVDPSNQMKTNYDLAVADQMIQISEQYDVFFDQLLSPAQNTPASVGIKCLKDAYRKELSGMQKKLDYLTNLITQVNEMDKKTKAELQMAKKAMDDLNYKLNGGTKSKSDGQKSFDLEKTYFNNAACKSVIPSSIYDSGTGVKGVKDFMTKGGSAGKSLRDMSSDMLAKESTYRTQLTTQISRMQTKIAKYGIEDWQKTFNMDELTRGGLTKFAGLKEVVAAEANNIMVARDRVANYLKDNVSYKLPPLDSNFSKTVGTFSKEAATYFKKKSIENCMTGSLGISTDQLISLINPPGQGTKKNVQSGLREILSQDGFITDKLNAIAALDKRYGIDKVTFKLQKGGATKTYTPYTYYRDMVNLCTEEYENDKTFSAKGESKVSDQQKVQQAENYLNELLNLEKGFNGKLAQAIEDEIVNCADAPKGAGSCNEESMSIESKDFCISAASTCATNVQQCAKHAENVYNSLRTELETKVKAYNTKIAAMVVEKNKLLQSEAFKAVFNSEWYGKYFNNSAYKLPENLVVSNPELAMSEYGFMTHGGDNLDFLDADNPENLTAQLEKLKEMITGQSEEVSKVVGDYITDQENAMKKNQEKWAKVKDKCKKAKSNYAAQAQQYNAEQAKKAQEVGQETNTWCSRYNSRPICGGTNSPSALMEDSLKISAYINPDALDALARAEKVCLEKEEGTDEAKAEKESDKKKLAYIVEECRASRKDKKLKNLAEDMAEEVLADADHLLEEINDGVGDGEDEVTLEDLESYLKGGDPSKSLEKLLKKSQAGKMAIQTHSLVVTAKETDQALTCGNLTEGIEEVCKKAGDGSCTAAKKAELQESLPSSSDNATIQAASLLNDTLESFESSKKRYANFVGSKRQMGEDAAWPSCTASSNGQRRMGESGASVDNIFNDVYNKVMGE